MIFWIFTLTPTFIVIPLLIHFLLSTLHSHLRNLSFVNVLDSINHFIKLKTCRFKCSVSFGTYTLQDSSSRVLQPLAHLSKLTAKG